MMAKKFVTAITIVSPYRQGIAKEKPGPPRHTLKASLLNHRPPDLSISQLAARRLSSVTARQHHHGGQSAASMPGHLLREKKAISFKKVKIFFTDGKLPG
jgi:hypothetical protein